MVSNIAFIIVTSLTFGVIVATFLMLHKLRRQIADMDTALMALSEILKAQADLDTQNKEALEHLMNRQAYQIILSKYNLAGIRLIFVAHKNACIEHEDYESAAQLEEVIQAADKLLSEE